MVTLKDRLSHLNFRQACKLLGPDGEKLIMAGGKFDINIDDDVVFDDNTFKLKIDRAEISINLDPAKRDELNIQCDLCPDFCIHTGAALSLILEEKLLLGLSALPPEKVPVESLTEEELTAQALELRVERARTEKMVLKSLEPEKLWIDYIVTNRTSGKSYRIALRGWERGESYCTCPDYRKNTLVTCKHILHALDKVKKRFPKKTRETPYKVEAIAVYLRYSRELELRILIPGDLDTQSQKLISPIEDKPVTDILDLLTRIRGLERLGHGVTIYPDAEEYINNLKSMARIWPWSRPLLTRNISLRWIFSGSRNVCSCAGSQQTAHFW